MSNQIIQFNADTRVTLISHENRYWLTAEDVGRCLGYGAGNERKGVVSVFNRHSDEFSEEDTCVVNLTTQGQARQIRIFSQTGCVKLGFFSNTPTAKTFRKWAARVLAGEMQPQSSQLADLAAQNSMLKAALLKHHPEYRAIKVMYDGGLESWQIGMAVGLSRHSIRRKVTEMRKLGLLAQVKPRSLPAPAQQSLALEV